MPQQMKWRDAIVKVLSEADGPLHYNEITERIVAAELRDSLGATPAATVGAQITASIKHDGDGSPFARAGKGIFTLRNTGVAPKATAVAVEDEQQYEVISSFGMFWRKTAVEWVATPKLLGVQKAEAKPVDFCRQVGIYLLYDGREVIYVGRSTDRPLGRRLYEHTNDRFAARWDRFSWFGLLPVSEAGKLGTMPGKLDAAKFIPRPRGGPDRGARAPPEPQARRRPRRRRVPTEARPGDRKEAQGGDAERSDEQALGGTDIQAQRHPAEVGSMPA